VTTPLHERLRAARTAGLSWACEGAGGWAGLTVLEVTGPDAASFLHSQTTNQVVELGPGQGNLGARVTRTGHLVAVFGVHRLPLPVPTFWLVLPREDLARLRDDLDTFLIADDATLREVNLPLFAAFGERARALRAHLPSADEGASQPWPGGGWALHRSFCGDDGLVLVGTEPPEPLDPDVEPLVDALRIEAGFVRPAVDLAKKRLLPETGLEQLAVSATKGCYLGQEVIARVRTYGSLPSAMRALILDEEAGLAPGEDVVRADGERLGQAASSGWSPVEEGPVLLAFLGREHRTPGTVHELRTPTGLRRARVALLPLFRAGNDKDRARFLYERAVRTFADGEAGSAVDLLEQAIRLDPEHADAYEAIGLILGRSGRWEEAIDVFRRLEEVAPDEPLVHTNLSLFFMKIGDKSTAEAESALAARKAMARSAGGPARTASELAAEADQARRADAGRKEKMFRQVLDFDPDDPIALFGLGGALAVLGRDAEAVAPLSRAVEVDGKNAAVYLAWGKSLERLGRDTEAVVVYQKGMEVASRRGDLMPLKEMESRVLLLGAALP
jgi:folate-binding protein YgfZ